MKLSRSTFETQAFVLNWKTLEQLHSQITERLPKVTITVKCKDRLDREFETLDGLQIFNNPARSAITDLEIVARDTELEQRVSIALSSERRSNVRISLSADESNAIPINQICSDAVESLRPWYWWVARADWYWLVLGGWLGANLMSLLFKLFRAGNAQVTFSASSVITAHEVLVSLLTGFLPLLIGVILNSVRDRYFPMGVFAFGHGESRHTSDEVVRTVLIAGLAVSIVTSVMLSWFA